MRYNNREFESLNIQVELGDKYKANSMPEFKRNQKYVADTLSKNMIIGWNFTEAVMDDLVVVDTNAKNVEEINDMFLKIKPLFNKVCIGVFYHDFGDFDYNEQIFDDCLDTNLVAV